MDKSDLDRHISGISTHWSEVFKAQGRSKGAATAQRQLLRRYCGAVYRYVLGVLRDPDAAHDLSQEFALRFLRGDFKRAEPERGRFRDYLKTAIFHMLIDYRRGNQRRLQPLPTESDSAYPTAQPDIKQDDKEFIQHWREELLDRAWEALEEAEQQTGQPYYTVLRWRSENPKEPATRLAEELSVQRSKPFKGDTIRQLLHRARERFADELLEDVARTLESPTPDRLHEELAELGLLAYCRPALERREMKT